jgi:hypothetical protein
MRISICLTLLLCAISFAQTRMESENAVNTNCVRIASAGASGGYYLDPSEGAGITYTYTTSQAGTYSLEFRGKVPSASTRSWGVYVNTTKIGVVTFTSTAWVSQTVQANLNSGSNLIKLQDSEGTAEADQDYLVVTYTGTTPSLAVSPVSLSFSTAAGSQTLGITSNVGWSVSQNQSWISTSPASGSNNGTVAVTVTGNTGTVSRSGTVTVTGSGLARTVSITQSASSVTISDGVTYTTLATPVSVTANNTVVLMLPFTAPSAGHVIVSVSGLYGTKNACSAEQRGLDCFITLNSTIGGAKSEFVEKDPISGIAHAINETAGFPVAAGLNTLRLILSPRTTLSASTYRVTKCTMAAVFSATKL